jgi:hypothetical protein
MQLYLNELAPWERKSEYYHNLQLGKDVNRQANALRAQAKCMQESQLARADALLASQDRIREGLDFLNERMDGIQDSLYDLKSSFEWGISEVVWQLEQNRTVLKEIVEILMAPLDTQAKERKRRAEEAYANQWMDDAEDEFLESEKLNKYDFTIHLSLGMIRLFHSKNKMEALASFEKAIKYATPQSTYHACYAKLYKALILFDLGRTKEAEACTDEVIGAMPDFLEARYQNAQYNAQLHQKDKCLAQLRFVIDSDRTYCLKAQLDPLMQPVRTSLQELFETLREQAGQQSERLYKELLIRQFKLFRFFSAYQDEPFYTQELRSSFKQFQMDLKGIKQRIDRNSLYDFLEINEKIAPECTTALQALTTAVEQSIDTQSKLVHELQANEKNAMVFEKNNHKSMSWEYVTNAIMYIYFGSYIVPTVLMLFLEKGIDKLLALLFCIPYLSQLFSISFIVDYFFNIFKEKDHTMLVLESVLVGYILLGILVMLVAIVISKWKSVRSIRASKDSLEKSIPVENRLSSIREAFRHL